MNIKKIKYKKAFTLIELMLVIAIIGILASIAIPNYISYRQKGYNMLALTDAKNFYTAAISNASGEKDIVFDKNNLPIEFKNSNNTFKSGAFNYTAQTGAISCVAVFQHPSGSIEYTLDSEGNIKEKTL